MSKPTENVRPVRVDWIDSISQPGWGNLKEPMDMKCVSVGMLIEKTPKHVLIAQNASTGCYGEHMQIPMAAVQKITRLK